MTDTDFKQNFKGGGSFVSQLPIFSDNAQNLYVCWKNLVIGYNTKTGKKIIEFKGLTDAIIGFKYHYLSGYECITACSESGEILTWKADTGFRFIKKNLPFSCKQIKSFNIIPSPYRDNEDNWAIISWADNREKMNFAIFNITSTKMSDIKHLQLKNRPFQVDVVNSYFAIIQKKKLYYSFFDRRSIVHKKTIGKQRYFTCVTCHPKENCLLTGDNTGRVILWNNLELNNCTQTIYHWHTLPVKTISFSASGNYFYSGAKECVLVKWEVDNIHQKNFLPRQSAAIKHIAVSNDNLYIAIATADNAIKIVDSKFEFVSLIQHLVLGDKFPCGINFDFRTKALVMNGFTGHLQFYTPNDMTLLYNLDVIGKNKLTDERECNIENTEVIRIALSKNGLWLVTYEERDDNTFSLESRLKFWKFNEEKQHFQLNTSIEHPHDSSIKDIVFQPVNIDTDLKCITIGKDKKFNIWQLVEVTTVYSKGFVWNCQNIGYYRDEVCNSLAFSYDGSLFAVGFGSILTTWLPDSCELKCSLLHPSSRNDLTHIKFGVADQCHLIATASTDKLSVWNLLTLSMMWTVPLKITHLVADPFSTHMAAFTSNNKVFIFSPASSTPIFSKQLNSKDVKILASAFVPISYIKNINMGWYQQSHLYFVDSNQELYSLSPSEEITEPSLLLQEDTDSSVFNLIFQKPSRKPHNLPSVHYLSTKEGSSKTLEKFLEAPVHTMIPVRLTCGSILRSMVLEDK